MHSILRAFVTATSLLIKADKSQIDERGRTKAVSTVWSEMPRMSARLIHVAEELLDDSTLAAGEPLEDEEQWLKAIIDEVGTPSPAGELTEDETWESLSRYTAWLAFCLRQSASYAEDAQFGVEGFSRVRDVLKKSDDFERAVAVAAITAAGTHLESTESQTSKLIAAAYDDLIQGIT